jgi:hypothetical protein
VDSYLYSISLITCTFCSVPTIYFHVAIVVVEGSYSISCFSTFYVDLDEINLMCVKLVSLCAISSRNICNVHARVLHLHIILQLCTVITSYVDRFMLAL